MEAITTPAGKAHVTNVRALNICPVTQDKEVVEFDIEYTNTGNGVEIVSLRQFLQQEWNRTVEDIAQHVADCIHILTGAPTRVQVRLLYGLTTTALTPWAFTAHAPRISNPNTHTNE